MVFRGVVPPTDVSPIQGLCSIVNSFFFFFFFFGGGVVGARGWLTEDPTAQLKKQMPLLLSGLGQNEALMSQ